MEHVINTCAEVRIKVHDHVILQTVQSDMEEVVEMVNGTGRLENA